MKEIKDIIQSYNQWCNENKKCALATVISVEGSAYRRPGARMLVSEDGILTGAISGGCLEGDAMKKALNVIHSQKPALVTYDTMDEDDAVIGVGLGCNGIIKILIEPIDYADSLNPVCLLKQLTQRRKPAVIATFFAKETSNQKTSGTKVIICDGEERYSKDLSVTHQTIFDNNYPQVLDSKKSHWVDFDEKTIEYGVFLEFIPPAVQLVIAGAGNDVKPLTEIAHILGWESIVLDGRANYAQKDRFPAACQVKITKPEQVLQQVFVDEYTYFVLMTHNYNYDKTLLKELTASRVKYIGLLGPKKKFERILNELEEEGTILNSDQISSIYAPVGVDIGAETSEEIALSVITEIKAIHSNKKSSHLRYKVTPIHA